MKYELRPIGTIHTPFRNKEDIPCQGYKSGEVGTVEIYGEFEEALKDVEGFSHIYLVYYFHESDGYEPMVKPFLDDREYGVFATRHYNRPNPIGISVVRLIGKEKNVLAVGEVDMLDGTPLLDIKPYVPQFDQRTGTRIGWLEGKIQERERQEGEYLKKINIKPKIRAQYILLRLRDKLGVPFSPEAEIRKLDLEKGQKILDFGCGFGSHTFPAARLVGRIGMVYALDKEQLAIKMLEEKAKKEGVSNIETIQSDMDTGLPDESMDVVFLYGVLPEIEQKEPLLQELHRVLRPDGYLSTRFCFRIKKKEVMEIMDSTDLYSLKEQKGNILNYSKK